LENPEQTGRIAELEADNARLRRLLDRLGAPAELRHRLRSTMAMLRKMIRRTAETERDFASYVGHLEERMDALMRAQAVADERGCINLHDLLADELLHYCIAEDDRAVLSGPDVELRPRAGQVLAIAVHELAINAVEHGCLGIATGRVQVTWMVSMQGSSALLTLDWKELGGSNMPRLRSPGFGSEVLNKMLAYELKAQTNTGFEVDGFRCTISFPLHEQIGRWVAG